MFYPNFYLRTITKQLLLLCGILIIICAFLMATILFHINNLKTHQLYYKSLEHRSMNLTLEQKVALKSELTSRYPSRTNNPYDLQAYRQRSNNGTYFQSNVSTTLTSNNTLLSQRSNKLYRPLIELGQAPNVSKPNKSTEPKPSFATMGNCNDFYIINGYLYLGFHCYTTMVCAVIVVLYTKILLLARRHRRQIMSAASNNGVPDIVRAPTGVKVGDLHVYGVQPP